MEVKNLIDAKGGVWLARDVESILSIPLVPSLSNDRLVWHYAKDGILIKTIYHLGMELVECKESWTQALATSNKKKVGSWWGWLELMRNHWEDSLENAVMVMWGIWIEWCNRVFGKVSKVVGIVVYGVQSLVSDFMVAMNGGREGGGKGEEDGGMISRMISSCNEALAAVGVGPSEG
ncbi:hypothetical protein M9H77_22913 [Catharanthus roseus]|uniref:Uncharacterized protein n=1 Tax=Catharanthus roseus TaxID=4058 RepID=A0ACC0ATJ3_CATRO|nr:hypothetical protein M9H77_22913 [Catharanthus roseus]